MKEEHLRHGSTEIPAIKQLFVVVAVLTSLAWMVDITLAFALGHAGIQVAVRTLLAASIVCGSYWIIRFPPTILMRIEKKLSRKRRPLRSREWRLFASLLMVSILKDLLTFFLPSLDHELSLVGLAAAMLWWVGFAAALLARESPEQTVRL